MESSLSQYKDLFLQTSKEYLQSLNTALLKLEKDPANQDAIADIFRSAHTLNSQSAAMGYQKTGYLCHAIEDVFYEIKEGRLKATPDLADELFSAFDTLTASIDHIEADGTEVDVAARVEALKKLTGITTQGAGKSARPGEGAATSASTAPNSAPEPKAEAKGESAKSKKGTATKPAAKVAVKATSKGKRVEAKGASSEQASVGSDTGPTEEKDSVRSREEGVPAANTNEAPQAETAGAEVSGVAPTTPQIKTIPVKVEQLDEMMNLLEELLVHGLALKKLARELDRDDLRTYQDQVEKITSALQFHVMKVRAVPVKMVFDHFPRTVRDLGRTLGKQIDLIVQGDDLELDRTIVERLDEPLIHIIRNAADHGIVKVGQIRLTAHRERDSAVVEVSDNGMGIDWPAVAKKAGVPATTDPAELKKYIFSGLSTSESVTQVSGRGVGLQVVKKTIEDFGGSIDVRSIPEHGTTFVIKLPLTLAVMRALLVQVGADRYAIPATSVDRSVQLEREHIRTLAGQAAFVLEDNEVPLVRLDHKFAPATATSPSSGPDSALPEPALPARTLAVVATIEDERVGFIVDDIIEASEIIVKPVPEILRGNRAFAGTTILGDGRSALILNLPGLL